VRVSSWTENANCAGISRLPAEALSTDASTEGAVTRFTPLRPVSLAKARQAVCGSETFRPLCRGSDGGRASKRHHVSSGRSAALAGLGFIQITAPKIAKTPRLSRRLGRKCSSITRLRTVTSSPAHSSGNRGADHPVWDESRPFLIQCSTFRGTRVDSWDSFQVNGDLFWASWDSFGKT
jgi:hypothetical protein